MKIVELTDSQHCQNGPVCDEGGDETAPDADPHGGHGSHGAALVLVDHAQVEHDGGEEEQTGDEIEEHQVDHKPEKRRRRVVQCICIRLRCVLEYISGRQICSSPLNNAHLRQ